MSLDTMIVEIQNQPVLWMSAHPDFKNRPLKTKLWQELAIKVNMQECLVKKKWKNLKDQFRKEVKKKYENEDWNSGWHYFGLLQFMISEFIPSGYSTSYVDPLDNGFIIKQENTDQVDNPASPSSSSSYSSAPSTSRKRENVREATLDLEVKKFKLMKKQLAQSQRDDDLKNDPDYMFLMSILPTMRNLNEYAKFQFRGKINEWLMEVLASNT